MNISLVNLQVTQNFDDILQLYTIYFNKHEYSSIAFLHKRQRYCQFEGNCNYITVADANNITITASNDTTALNLGTGSGLFTSKSGDNLQFKSIIANADSGISLTSNSNDLTLQLVSANVDAGKLGGVAASDYLRKSDNLLSVASAATARTNLSVLR